MIKCLKYTINARDFTLLSTFGSKRHSQVNACTLIENKSGSLLNGHKVCQSLMSSGKAAEKCERVDLETNIAIIGGGAIGSSVAFWLKQKNRGLCINVIERDDTVSISFTC